MAVDLASLAREREARNRSRPTRAPAPPVRPQPPPASAGTGLAKAHRSVRMAHAVGLLLCAVVAPVAALLLPIRVALMAFGGGYLAAMSGGGFVHSALPENLREGGPPASPDVVDGLFNAAAFRDLNGAWDLEYDSALECLAFACTYGKQNCLTNDMYSGDLSLGKIWTLVSAKLKEGVIKCD